MNDTLFFAVAVFVFVMMAIGLVLTVVEFRYGQPRREVENAPETVNEPNSHRARPELWLKTR